MKKMQSIIRFLILMLSMSPAHALDGQGEIEEVINCGFGSSSWKQVILFKLSDGNWFGSYADYEGATATDNDSNSATSLILMAFSAGLPVEVRATYHTGTYCGVSATFHWNNVGDYIKVTK